MREYAARSRTPGLTSSYTPRGGRPLDVRTRAAFESRFAHDFSQVRVHTGIEADAAARSMDALAFASGRDLVFRRGAYSPRTAEGRTLLAHELAHVAQGHRDGAIHRKGPGGAGGDPAEQQADRAAERANAMPPELEALLARVNGSVSLLRAELAAAPALAAMIEDFFLTGTDSTLSDLLARAFPPRGAAATTEKEKDPVNPAVPLPAARADSKVLTKGTMTWDLHALDHSSARIDLDFHPDPDKVDARNISFVQTILNTLGSNTLYPGASVTDTVGRKAAYSPFEESTEKRRVDHVVGTENDPFYGAEWDNSSTPKKWKNESGGTVVGKSSTAMAKFADSLTPTTFWGGVAKRALRMSAATSAKMNDNPGTAMGRLGKGETTKQFETVPVVLETREPLGAIKWGYKIGDAPNAPLELTGATQADVTDAPSATWGAALDKFYTAKFEILDEFDQDKWDLKPAHKTTLDGIVTRMKANASLTAELGGAADLKDADASGTAQKRADAAKDYLVSKGIDAGRLTTQAYGSDWAKVATTAGAAEPKNRRVQIWVK